VGLANLLLQERHCGGETDVDDVISRFLELTETSTV